MEEKNKKVHKPWFMKSKENKETKKDTLKIDKKEEKELKKESIKNTKRKKEEKELNIKSKEKNKETKNKETKKKETNKNNNLKANSQSEKNKVKIIPLGGLYEIGKNMTAFEYNDSIFVLDCGLAFPGNELLGVDLVIPDFSYLEKNKDKVKALVITHGHEDHIGGIPYFLKKINVPIYATKLTLGLIGVKLDEHRLKKDADLRTVKAGDTIKIDDFEIEFIRVNHSIADSVGIAIKTKEGVIVHTGDFKIDYTPIDGEIIDLGKFAELGNQGVTLLMADSTNALRPGYTMSEKSVGDEFDRIFINCNKRIIVATFASNIHRMQQIVNSAVLCKRKVAVVGRSMTNMIKVGKKLGYIDIPEGTLIDIDKIGLYNNNQLVIITTGSQGESMAALSRMSAGEHKQVNITKDDLVIFSSSPIPGNEKSVSRVIDELEKLGADVIYNELADVHVSGHACQEELKIIHSLVKPKYFMPVHGEFRFLKHHAELSESLGIKKGNTFILENGCTLEMSNNEIRRGLNVESGVTFIDGLGVGDVGNVVLRDRQCLSENGVVIIIISMDRKTSELVAEPEIATRGFIYVKENEELMNEMKLIVKEEIELCLRNKQLEWSIIKSNIRETLAEFIYKKTKRDPMILPIISEVDVNNYFKKKVDDK